MNLHVRPRSAGGDFYLSVNMIQQRILEKQVFMMRFVTGFLLSDYVLNFARYLKSLKCTFKVLFGSLFKF